MSVDVMVSFTLKRGAPMDSAYRVRAKLNDASGVRVRNQEIFFARNVGGGVGGAFTGDTVTGDAVYEALNTRDARIAAMVLTGLLVEQGFKVSAADEDVPEPGEATVRIKADPGQA